jgi:hypothetical protein
MGGFDSALDRLEDDQLDRRRVARQIYAMLTDLSPEWSVRVGLFGSWGSGKTSIALWVKKLAEVDEHLPIWFNPWAVRTLGELWTAFAAAIFQALDENGINLDGAKRLRAAVAANNWKELPKKLAEADSRAKAVVSAGSQLMDYFLRIEPTDLELIRKKLGERRVMVIVDDLDRADPQLLPQLLLSLRELVDLAGFSFLLPFDKAKVVAALEAYNTGWDGEAFLDKILDFRVTLPEPTSDQLQRMFVAEMKLRCPFVPEQSLSGFGDLLPPSPRHLKLLVRHVATYRLEAARHGPDELDWPSLIYTTLLRLESEQFFDAFVRESFGDATANPWIVVGFKGETGAAEERSRALEIAKRAQIDGALIERLLKICDAWRGRLDPSQILRVPYMLSLASRPDALTWREFYELFDLWTVHHRIDPLVTWVKEHAPKRATSPEAVAAELVDTVLKYYRDQVERASSVALLTEHERVMSVASETLALLKELLTSGLPGVIPELLTGPIFSKVLETAEYWIEFRANPADQAARAAERELLLGLVASEQSATESIADAMARYKERAGLDGSTARQQLVADIIEARRQPSAQQLLQRLSKENGLSDLFDPARHNELREILFDPEGALWKRSYADLDEVLRDSSRNPIVQKNALQWLELIDAAVRQKVFIDGPLITAAVTSLQNMSALWRAATAQPLQFRRLKGLRDLRERLLKAGLAEAAAPIPDWLVEQDGVPGLSGNG